MYFGTKLKHVSLTTAMSCCLWTTVLRSGPEDWTQLGLCHGGKLMHVCVYLTQTQACPLSSKHTRAVQCSSYDNQPFMGRLYKWEPFNEGSPDTLIYMQYVHMYSVQSSSKKYILHLELLKYTRKRNTLPHQSMYNSVRDLLEFVNDMTQYNMLHYCIVIYRMLYEMMIWYNPLY